MKLLAAYRRRGDADEATVRETFDRPTYEEAYQAALDTKPDGALLLYVMRVDDLEA